MFAHIDTLKAARKWRKSELNALQFTPNDLTHVAVEDLAVTWAKRGVLTYVIEQLDAQIAAAEAGVGVWLGAQEAARNDALKHNQWGA